MANGDLATFVAGLNEINAKVAPEVCEKVIKGLAEYKPDLVLAGTLTQFWSGLTTYVKKIPTVDVKLQFLPPNPARQFWGLPNLPFGLNGWFMKTLVMGPMYDGWKEMVAECEKLEGYKSSDYYTKDMWLEDVGWSDESISPFIIGQPSFYKGTLYGATEVPGKAKLVGQFVLPEEKQVTMAKEDASAFGGGVTRRRSGNFGTSDNLTRMSAFIAAGSKPAYIGWGSMICKSPEFMVELVAKALQASGQRAIILAGWVGLSMELLRTVTTDKDLLEYMDKNALFVTKAPHEWLFKQCSCIVHHGGAGTLGCAMRSGVPQVITPIFLDQWDHSHLINQVGNGHGFPKQLQKITPAELGDAMKKVTGNPDFAVKAKEASMKICAEDGVAYVVDYIDKFWREECVTGKWKAKVEARLKPKPPKPTFLQKLGKMCCGSS
jgi:hypothetical protein